MRTEFKIDDNQIAILTLNHPQKSVNILDEIMIEEIIAHLDRFVTDAHIKGLILTSAKSSFIAGVDLSLLGGMQDQTPVKFRDFLMRIHQSMRAVEKSHKPFVAAINGTVLGGGLELCLGADYRIAANQPKSQIGFPEMKLGIFPGMGGSVRLPRLIGLQAGLEIMLKGQVFDFNKAKMFGMIHEIVEEKVLIDQAKAWILNNTHVQNPLNDLKNFRHLNPFHPKTINILMGANSILRSQTKDLYPNSQIALQSIYETLTLDMDQALALEANYFTHCLFDPRAQAMIKTLFLDRQMLASGKHAPLKLDSKTQKVIVVGAGFMGSGIALACAVNQINVVLIDQNKDLLDKALIKIKEIIEKGIRNKKIHERISEIMERIHVTSQWEHFPDAQIAIEAVYEDRAVKKSVLQKIEQHVSDDCLIASNTSTLPISSLAVYLSRPERFAGIHFFSPVHLMQLVEIIQGEKSDDKTITMAVNFVKQIKKVSIIVNDGRGFYTTRVVISYLNEGMRLLNEGVAPAIIENAGKAIGMPVGPLALADEIALDLALRIRNQTKLDLGDNWVDDQIGPLLEWMVNDSGRLGRKSKKGFYEYPDGHEKYLWPELVKHFQSNTCLEFEQVKQRLLYRQLHEVSNVISEGILVDKAQINVGAILGFGFCPWSGGPTYLIDKILSENADDLDSMDDRFQLHKLDYPK